MSLRKVIALFGAAGVLGACAVQPQAPGSDALPSTSPQDDFLLYDWLVEEEAATDSAMRVQVTQDDLDALAEPTIPLRVGVTKELDAKVAFGGLGLDDLTPIGHPVAHGAIRANGSGFVWTGMVESPGAEGMRLQFEDFYLPRDVVLYQYNDYGNVAGPYAGYGLNSDGEFWSHTLPGDRVYLQLRYDGKRAEQVLGEVRMTVADVGHLHHAPSVAGYRSQSALCPGSTAPCVLDAVHHATGVVNQAVNAVAKMSWVAGPYLYTCSGGLIDTDPPTGDPLFLTANHCISKNKDAKNMEAWFSFEGDENCGNYYGPWEDSTLGATVRSTGRAGDYTILELNLPLPAGTEFLPWNDADISSADGTMLYRISHPNYEPQGYSEHSVDANTGTCTSWPRGERIYSHDEAGATMGGSSGSPVLNGAGEIVGQLSGCCGYDCGDDCNADDNSTVDGNLAFWIDTGDARSILQPTPCTDADEDGFCADVDCDDTDPAINPGAIEICDDLIDNDCDNAIDGEDSDCNGECLGNKEACQTNDECCSNKCNRGTCRGN
jgi:V8-like Glu-specific endopeptidase